MNHNSGPDAACSSNSFSAFICISGKRKTGKDFVTRRLASLLARRFPTATVSICALSDPLKEEFALQRGIEDPEELKGDGPAKELVRREMIAFGEELRAKDTGYFCRKALARRRLVHGPDSAVTAAPTRYSPPRTSDIILISDCRRPSDLAFFRAQFPSVPVLFVRVECPVEVRQQRGFEFQTGVDDADSECALDEHGRWDALVKNDGGGGEDELEKQLEGVVKKLEFYLAIKSSNGK